MDKLKFEFIIKSDEDMKKNVLCITSITNADKEIFLIPAPLQPAKMHEEVIKTSTFQKIKTTLQKRHEKRQVWIALTPEMSKEYIDEDGNMQFKNYLLEESTIAQHPKSNSGMSEETMKQLIENLVEMKNEAAKPHNIRSMTDKFVLQKFSRKTSNAAQWMTIYETECTRVGINESITKIEILRSFLEDSCLDWYSSMLIKHTVNSEWTIWKQSFCETYVDSGWSPIRYAMTFKYKQGALLDYALKKERLLLEINKSMDKTTLIDLIATGLPNIVSDKIERSSLKETEDLFKSIRSLEYLVNNKYTEMKIASSEMTKIKEFEKKPCKICYRENKGNRYHTEAACWFRKRTYERPWREQIRSVNNSELETELNEINPKN